MKAYRIQNDMVAADDEQAAIAAWATHYGCSCAEAGPVEEIDPNEVEIDLEEENETWRPGKLAEAMPTDGPAQIVAFGECEDCG